MQKYANIRGEIKRVLSRKHDKLKFVVIPRKSDIEAGDYVLIKKIRGLQNETITSSWV